MIPMQDPLLNLFTRPGVIGVVADADTGKSNFLYSTIERLRRNNIVQIWTYGLRCHVDGTRPFHSVRELEKLRNCVVFADEIFNLFDLDNKKARAAIERTIRLVYHNNNVLVLSGLGENFKKFLSAKLNAIVFKRVTIADLINGSSVKNTLMAYTGDERGQAVLDLTEGEALLYDGEHFTKLNVPYLQQYDTKAKNVPILVPKKVPEKVQGNLLRIFDEASH